MALTKCVECGTEVSDTAVSRVWLKTKTRNKTE
jgi:hypothetical protein